MERSNNDLEDEYLNRQWWKESVVYQIYPRSFKDSDGDGIGDLRGIIGKLDYLKDLGVDVIWLSPIYKSHNADNGYDIDDYQDIMDEFGTMEDFDRLLEQAHDKGLKIILDLVVNHTSIHHEWFKKSRESDDSPYADFYHWRKGDETEPVNRWESYFGGSVWEYDENRESYYLHLFAKEQPDLNWENRQVRGKVYAMMKWWLDKGIDGFRMDVINHISKVDGLPEGERIGDTGYTEKEPLTVCGPRLNEYLKEMHEEVLSKYDIMTVGETPAISVEEALKITDPKERQLNMVFQFEHMDVENEGDKWSDKRFRLTKLKGILSKWQYGLNNVGWNSLYWNNHDQPRVVSRFGDDKCYWKESAKMLATCLHMLKGTPYIYQGEEIGMTNIALDRIEDYKDVETLGAYKKYTEELGIDHETMMSRIHARSRDNARTPMQWDDSSHAGFTEGVPWFDANPNYRTVNAASQLKDETSILNYYKKLIRLRKEHEVIVHGEYTLLMPDSEEVYAYIRTWKDQVLLVVCNFTDRHVSCDIPVDESLMASPELLVSNYERGVYEQQMDLEPYETLVYLNTLAS